jgi:hypothetical protein
MRGSHRDRGATRLPEGSARSRTERELDQAIEQSFPASDPSTFTVTTGVGSKRVPEAGRAINHWRRT